jgi:hypothetical protein
MPSDHDHCAWQALGVGIGLEELSYSFQPAHANIGR